MYSPDHFILSYNDLFASFLVSASLNIQTGVHVQALTRRVCISSDLLILALKEQTSFFVRTWQL